MKLYGYLYYILIASIFLILFKFGFDFYYLNRSNIKIQLSTDVYHDKFIIKPRLQVTNNGRFEYMWADRGFLGAESEYVFENVNSIGHYGNISAGKLVIKNNENVLEFTIDPRLSIYL